MRSRPGTETASHVLRQDDLIRLAASGLVDLAEREAGHLREGVSPYPLSLQRVLSQLTLASWAAGRTPPGDITALVRWCRLPLKDWPFALPVGLASEEDALVSDAGPTQLCLSLALDAGNPELEIVQNRIMGEAVRRCRDEQLQAAYQAFRRLCIEEPVLDARRWARVQRSAVLNPVADLVDQAYVPVPTALQVQGVYAACRSCRGLMMPRDRGGWICALDQCRLGGTWRRVGSKYPADRPLWMLRRALRLFTHGPGLAELALERDAAAIPGVVAVVMWPGIDLVDLLIVFANGAVWAIDVKDHANPDLLAPKLSRFPAGDPLPSYQRAVLAIPQYREGRAPGFSDRVRDLCPFSEHGFDVETIPQLLCKARREANRAASASGRGRA